MQKVQRAEVWRAQPDRKRAEREVCKNITFHSFLNFNARQASNTTSKQTLILQYLPFSSQSRNFQLQMYDVVCCGSVAVVALKDNLISSHM
jgi:hypothetical protein